MSVELLSRIQFAVTVGFHFLFPPVSIGLAWLLALVEWRAWREDSAVYRQMGRFFGKLLGLTFAAGVVTGIVMEFQFGSNWARYSRFVGDIFGAPLAAEAIFAFFLESTFLGLYLLGRGRVSQRTTFVSVVMVAIGATISAFWIIVANSWMQTPAGYRLTPEGRAELADFWAAVFNPSTMLRFGHTLAASLACGAFFMAGVGAYILLRNRRDDAPAAAMARSAVRIGVVAGLVASLLVLYPLGHHHARQVARLQPEKFAAIEGLYTSQHRAPLVMFALPYTQPPELKAKVEVPGLLSWMAFGDVNAHVPGIDQFPPENIPPLWLTFVSFHNMVLLGMFLIALGAVATVQLRGGRLFRRRWLLWTLVAAVPAPVAACQFGWVAAEVGRQPWIVYKLMRTADAFSSNLSPGQVLFSLIAFCVVYLVLGTLYFLILFRKMHQEAAGH